MRAVNGDDEHLHNDRASASSASIQGATQWDGLGKPYHMNHIPSFAPLPVMASAALGTGGSLTRRALSSQQDRYICRYRLASRIIIWLWW